MWANVIRCLRLGALKEEHLDRRLAACEAAIGAILLVTFIVARDLPMVDLPQHAAQIAVWFNLGKPEYHSDQFALNLRTPYLLAYLVANVLASAVGVIAALKLVVWLAVVGQVLGLHFLCKQLGHDPRLALLGLPLALGYTFLFGFVSYIVAMPFLYLCVGLAASYAARPSLTVGAMLVAALLAVLLSHGFAFAQSMLFVSPLLMFGKGPIGLRALPLLVPIAVAAAWLLPGPVGTRLGVDTWEPGLGRLVSLPGMLVGSGSKDIAASVYGFILIALFALTFGRPVLTAGRLLPGVFVLLGFCMFPEMHRGYSLLWQRFAMLVVPALLLAFRPGGEVGHKLALGRRAAIFGAVALWLGIFEFRLSKFNQETAGFHAMVNSLPRGLRIRPLVFDAESEALPDLPTFTHLPAYYLVDKGGMQGYSFAIYPSSVIRYRNGIGAKMNGGQEWQPEAFRADAELHDYDCFMVHSKKDRYQQLFGTIGEAVRVRAHAMDWWSYCARID